MCSDDSECYSHCLMWDVKVMDCVGASGSLHHVTYSKICEARVLLLVLL